jgi:pyruvate formate lyase activating enzyme
LKEASFWKSLEDDKVQCELCPHCCTLSHGKRGVCRIRENRGGVLFPLTYGRPVSLAVDPVEKKPLFHVYPGSRIYSVGLAGCNMRCAFCQNYDISQSDPEDLTSYDAPPKRLVEEAMETGSQGIAFTYNEPTISAEYAIDTFELARQEGLYTCFVTNGYVNPGPAREIAEYLDCANVDLKSSDPEFYRELCRAPEIEAVKEAIRIWNDAGVALEITNLLIPGKNDSPETLDGIIEFVLELGTETPLHFSRFHPAYKLRDVMPTPGGTVERAVQMARDRGIVHVYAGNLPGSRWENTTCPTCGSELIQRRGYYLGRIGLDDENKCEQCGRSLRLLGSPVTR